MKCIQCSGVSSIDLVSRVLTIIVHRVSYVVPLEVVHVDHFDVIVFQVTYVTLLCNVQAWCVFPIVVDYTDLELKFDCFK